MFKDESDTLFTVIVTVNGISVIENELNLCGIQVIVYIVMSMISHDVTLSKTIETPLGSAPKLSP